MTLGQRIAAAAKAEREAHEELVRLSILAYNRGASTRQIERYAGVSYATIARWCSVDRQEHKPSALDDEL